MENNINMIKKLACPKCKGEIEFLENKNGFNCPVCKLFFPIEDGIYILRLDKAIPFNLN
jgi:uncharacterized protein YbaR (Trm112 family)